ncbi:helix-hairpin-helix domain-containing protein [Herbinix hemicellulosilytica]|nr:helix-hairpin-helix domain-containing protein [Herbinix hemicellulosilytica]
MKNRKLIMVILSCLFFAVAGLIYTCSFDKGKNDLITSLESSSDYTDLKDGIPDGTSEITGDIIENGFDARTDEIPVLIYVHLCGAVENPDVYKVETGTRLAELIKLAGGLKADAAGDYVNQAMEVKDGQRIYIPTKDELKDLTPAEYVQGNESVSFKEDVLDSRVNINTADESALMSLPGIGQARAKSIIEYRDKHGNFSDIKDLMKVPGIKEGLFSRIADKITVGN